MLSPAGPRKEMSVRKTFDGIWTFRRRGEGPRPAEIVRTGQWGGAWNCVRLAAVVGLTGWPVDIDDNGTSGGSQRTIALRIGGRERFTDYWRRMLRGMRP